MSVNSSSNSSHCDTTCKCLQSRMSYSSMTALLITYMLVMLPLFAYVLYLGCRHWRKLAVSSHSDIFTLNMVFLEVFGVCGFFLFYLGTYCSCSDRLEILMAALCVTCFISPGQTLFPPLTCVDLYLAVVRPITYLGLRRSTGVLIRNVSIGCVWLLCLASLTQTLQWDMYLKSNILFLSISFTAVSFCCFSVLAVLTRPGPGETGGLRKRADPSKQRAFLTITAVTVALFVRLWAILAFYSVMSSPVSSLVDSCLILLVSAWLSLPSSLVLPLLFLQRAGKLALPKH